MGVVLLIRENMTAVLTKVIIEGSAYEALWLNFGLRHWIPYWPPNRSRN